MGKQQVSSTTKKEEAATAEAEAFPYEFGGPVGAFITILALPLVVLLLVHWSHVGAVDFSFWQDAVEKFHHYQHQQQQHYSSMTSSLWSLSSYCSAFWNTFLESPVLCPGCRNNNNNNNNSSSSSSSSSISSSTVPAVVVMMGAVIAWFLFQVFLERFLPCELVQGCPIEKRARRNNNRNNKNNNNSSGDKTTTTTSTATFRLTYRINGHLAFWVTFLVVFFACPYWHDASQTIQFTSFPIELLYQYNAELALATILLCFALSVYLYLDSFSSIDNGNDGNDEKVLAVGGDSGNAVYDFFIGRELNPRIGGGGSSSSSFDWKEFCELRPGLIGWVLLNMSCMKQQYINFGGHVSGSMMLINVFQGFYVWDALYQERAILSTMDITTDGFGFMLVFGDLAWVPFTYSLQARYLVHHDPHLSCTALALIVAIHMIGYYIFRSANGQKDAFRRDPTLCQHLQYLQTKRGTKLLTSGWWGMARKINYTGDWIMGLSWCMVCGFESIVPYYYAIYFMILLIHRSIRDDHMCQAKYGEDWNKYKQIVPYRFIPGVV